MSELKTQEPVAQTVTGRVVSNKMEKTLTVVVTRKVKHPKYNKYVIRNTKLYVHDEENQSKEGDVVEIIQCRPISKSKCWKLHKIIEQKS